MERYLDFMENEWISENTGLLLRHSVFLRTNTGTSAARIAINHLTLTIIEVVQLGEVGGWDAMLLAAILHDTVEDTDTRPEEISHRFGEEVLSLVLEVTDDKNLPKQERKRLQIETAPYKSYGAKLIKLADKTCNVRNLITMPPKDWSLERRQEYLLWGEKVVAGLRGTNPALEQYYDHELASGKMLLGIV
jgi:hypothetical protein